MVKTTQYDTVSLDVILNICKVLNCDVDDIVKTFKEEWNCYGVFSVTVY